MKNVQLKCYPNLKDIEEKLDNITKHLHSLDFTLSNQLLPPIQADLRTVQDQLATIVKELPQIKAALHEAKEREKNES